MLSTSGDTHLGGDDFDKVIIVSLLNSGRLVFPTCVVLRLEQ